MGLRLEECKMLGITDYFATITDDGKPGADSCSETEVKAGKSGLYDSTMFVSKNLGIPVYWSASLYHIRRLNSFPQLLVNVASNWFVS